MMKTTHLYSRRQVLKYIAGLGGALAVSPWGELLLASKKGQIKIGACDWSLGEKGDITTFDLAKKIGLDGVQVSFMRNNREVYLLDKQGMDAYKHAAEKNNVKISGLALGILNQIPYKSDPRTEKWVCESIDVAEELGCHVILLAFFSKGDLKGDKKGTREVIRRLKKVAPKVEEKGIVLGIESWLSAKEHMEIIEAVGSDHVQVYYDVANSTKMGYNIYEEIRWLGSDHICQFHAKENGYLLGQGHVDFRKFSEAVHDIGYSGWIQIEGAIPKGRNILESYRHNLKYLHSLFNS